MKKRAIILLFFLVSFVRLFAQAPTWSVNESNFQYHMTFVAKLYVDGVRLKNSKDLVGAFVGSSCRGASGLTYVASENSYFAYLTVFSNSPGETITFNLYDSSKNKITKVSKTINFEAELHLGNLFQSYSIAEPGLSNKAEIVSFDFLNINKISSVITSGSVKMGIPQGNPITSLTPVYVLSNGARLYKDRTLQNSGTTSISFSAPVTYEVVSEDESTLVKYTVEVTPTLVPVVCYKKDVVCYEAGVIKVVFPIEKENVVLTKGGVTLSTQSITAGQTIFNNLTEGTYQISVGGNVKEIKINLKPTL